MPDPKGVLSQEEKAVVKKWMEEHNAVRGCPQCGQDHWGIGDHLIQLPVTFIQVIYPAVMLICLHCAYFRFHSAITIGVVRSEAEKPERPEAPDGPAAS